MSLHPIRQFIHSHPDLFKFLSSDHTFPHDHLMARTVLRLFPQSVTPNQVTTVRIVLTPLVVWFFLKEWYIIGIISFLLVAFTDAIDGSMARTRNKITKFGMMYDPLADKLLIGIMVLLLVFQHFHYWLGVALLGIEIAFIAIALIAKYKFQTVRAANLWGKTKMISQCLAVFLTLVGLMLNAPQIISLASWVFGFAIGFAVLSLFSHGV